MRTLCVVVSLCVFSCGQPPLKVDAGSVFADGGPVGACHAVVQAHAIEGANHITTCSMTSYATNPPSSGNHYPVWAAYKTYQQPIPPGFLVHSLEHGGVVFGYNCDGGCADEVAALQAMIDALPVDPLCTGAGPKRRVVLAPDPALEVRFAAASWGFTLKADCFDAVPFSAFVAEHYAHGSEDLCADGSDVPTIIASRPECQWWFSARDGGP